MSKIFLFAAFYLTVFTIQADEFKLKLSIETVDHASLKGAVITAIERGKVYTQEKASEDGDVKLKLETGRLFEVWIQHDGYAPHVIHNVHSEGSGKFNITLYRSKEDFSGDIPTYDKAYRTFDDVKKLVIPVEMLNDEVNLVKEDAMPDSEKKALKQLENTAKDQEKTQKQIDKLRKSRSKLDKALADVAKDMSKGSITREEGNKKKEDLEGKIKDISKKIEKLAY